VHKNIHRVGLLLFQTPVFLPPGCISSVPRCEGAATSPDHPTYQPRETSCRYNSKHWYVHTHTQHLSLRNSRTANNRPSTTHQPPPRTATVAATCAAGDEKSARAWMAEMGG